MSHFEEALRDLASGRICAAEAQRLLRDRAIFSFRTNPAFVNWNEPLPADTEILLTVEDARGRLSAFWWARGLSKSCGIGQSLSPWWVPTHPPNRQSKTRITTTVCGT